jgi:LDH2 family malate/lactate/ureidoglycolate dehydrogenase
MTGPATYDYGALCAFATALGEKIGLPGDRSRTQAEILLEADLMGHTTHGLALLPGLLNGIESGAIAAAGEPDVLSDRGATVFWEAKSLPGTWVLSRAISDASARVGTHPVVTFVLRSMSHIGALGAYLRQATERGLMIVIMNSDPGMRTVAPAGGSEGQLAPNPLAVGYPTDGDPILIDISTASVANGWVRRWSAEGRRLPGKWLQDQDGNVTDEPAILFGNPPGAMLPLGGLELGHKGFALGLMVDAFTTGLAGAGRVAKSASAGTPVFLQIIDPNAFAGEQAFRRETGFLAKACRRSKPRAGVDAVRMPGDAAVARRRAQLEKGIALYRSIMPDLMPWADKLKVTPPSQKG